MGYAIATFVVGFLLMLSGLLLLFYREALGQRLAAILHPDGQSLASRARAAAETFGVFAASLRSVVPKSDRELSAAQKRLVRAGFREDYAVNFFYALKVLVPMSLCVVVSSTGLYQRSPFAIVAASAGIGYLLPDYFLDHIIRARSDKIARGLPDVLDLLVVCLEAGLSLDQSLLRAVGELRPAHPAIADELALVLLEVRAGRPRADAWRSLAERVDVDVVRLLVSVLVQADQFGAGVSRLLRTHSEAMRTKRRQKVEEMAAKTAVKLVFPLVLLIFPSIFVVTLGPAAIMISETLHI